MRGLRPDRIPELIAQDVKAAKECARIIININTGQISGNRDHKLNIIAIIGASDFQGRHYPEALLLEIGLGRSKPYHYAKYTSGKVENIMWRRNWFSLNEDQYRQWSPVLFKIFQGITDRKAEQRECGTNQSPYSKSFPKHTFGRRGNAVQKDISVPLIDGTRFAISTKETLFLRDIFWLELNCNKKLHGYLWILAQRIADAFRLNKARFCNRRLPLRADERFQNCRMILKTSGLIHSKYLLIEMMKYIPKLFTTEISSDLMQWDGEPTLEHILASQCLPDPQNRLGNIRLRVTTGLNGINEYILKGRLPLPQAPRDHIVFEVFPS